jgi:ferredoxin
MPTVTFVKQKKTVEVPEGANLRQVALENGVQVYEGLHETLNCMGFGLCCSCRMRVVKGGENLSREGIWEKTNLAINPFGFFARINEEDQHRIRLSCQTKVLGDVEVETTPEFNWHGEKYWA